jgi:putative phage-type endonuclease
MKDRMEWLRERQKGIGGSEIAAVCGLSKWKTPIDIWLEKTQPVEDSQPTLAMELGNYLEPLIVAKYRAETGNDVAVDVDPVIHSKYDFARCNLDGLIITPEGDKGVLEVKTAGDSRAWGEPGTDAIPDDYFCQCQWNMAVGGLTWAHVPVLFFDRGRRIEIYELEADLEFQDFLITKAKAFWQCVIQDKMPDPRSSEEAQTAWPKHERGKQAEAEEDTVNAIEQLKAVRAEMKQLKEAASMLEAQIKGAMQTAEKLVDGEKVLATWRTATTSRLNAAAVKEFHPEIAKQYTSISTSRRFLIK